VHAFAFEALRHEDDQALGDAFAWTRDVLGDSAIDMSSRDERLWRRASDGEVAAVLEGFWRGNATFVRERLRELLHEAGVPEAQHTPFDESFEDEMFPVLVDAGWELLPLAQLDRERHRGAMEAFGEDILFESARFEEGSSLVPPAYLQELPAIGPVELLRAVDGDGVLVEPLVLWTEGPDTYHDYILRGVARSAALHDA
jgi:hypothetical protein